MSKVIADATLHEKLQQAVEPLEIVGPDGRTLGYYLPEAARSEWLQPSVSEEELDRRSRECREKGGRKLADIMADLEKQYGL